MIQELLNTFKRFGIQASVIDLTDRVLRRAGITKIERVFTVTESNYQGSRKANVLSIAQIQSFRGAGKISCSESALTEVKDGHRLCIGVTENNTLCGYTWYTLRPYRHSDNDFAFFDSQYLCGYGAYISPEYRGQNIRGAIVACAIEQARARGKLGILAAITWTNFGSIRSAIRIGYRYHCLSYKRSWPPQRVRSPLYHLRRLPSHNAPVSAFIGALVSQVTTTALAASALALIIDTSSRDTPGMRQRFKQWFSGPDSLQQFAQRHGIAYIRYDRNQPQAAATEIKRHRIELLISYAAPILGDEIIESASVAAINIHPSRLPDYRGGSPLLWQVLREEPETGASLHLLTKKIDGGNLLCQMSAPLPVGLNRDGLFAMARRHSAVLLKEWLESFDPVSSLTSEPQPEQSRTPFARNMTLADVNEMTNWHQDPAGKLYALARYLGRWPAELMPPPGLWRWVPLGAIRFSNEPTGTANARWVGGVFTIAFNNAGGTITLAPSLNPWRWLSHWRNWRQQAKDAGQKVYL